ncbi:MAG: 16S rRNA (guanine(966)-N(2))-methyltransferase RsmD [Bacteroidetes bacterium]|nr:16S rRNA (guanine(966)-N(2))-methyltransferase RsmD [Bacteroidota bacterium]
MRIISGKYRGRRLQPPPGLDFRPTTDMAREALFNYLAHHHPVHNARVLDLFGGSGTVSIEFLSRGAAQVTTVEMNPKTLRWLKQCHTQLADPAWQITGTRVETYLAKAPNLPWDLIFMDPPYAMPGKAGLIARLQQPAWLAPGGLLIAEHATQEDLGQLPGATETRRYGQSSFTLFDAIQ